MLQFSNTQSISEFKHTFGVKSLNIQSSAAGKPFFTTDNGMDGLVSTKSIDAITAGNLSGVRISQYNDDETGREGWMIHNVRSSEGATTIIQL